MLAKLKLIGIVAVVGVLLSFMGSFAWKTHKLEQAINAYTEGKTSVVTEGVAENTLTKLNIRLDENERITKDSVQRLEDLKGELTSLTPDPGPPAPATVTVKTVYVDKPVIKDTPNEHQEKRPVVNTVVVARAFDELWRDFCQRFPDESDCREREAKSRQLQAAGTTRS